MYTYKLTIKRWVDGDTFDALVDLGFGISNFIRFRVLDVDTPERGQLNYVEARQFSESLFPIDSELISETIKSKDKYGRWLVALPGLKEKLAEANLLKVQ